MKELRAAAGVFIMLTLVTGVAYPLVITWIAQTLFAEKANGSLIIRDGAKVGSSLIGQDFSAAPAAQSAAYFWGRPSATGPIPYSAFNAEKLTGSSGSNLGPTNPALLANVQARIDALKAADTAAGYKRPDGQSIPVDLVTASGSGLDPHISLAAAEYQMARVAQARGMNERDLRMIVGRCTTGRQLGFLGEPTVNVLELNLLLDVSRE